MTDYMTTTDKVDIKIGDIINITYNNKTFKRKITDVIPLDYGQQRVEFEEYPEKRKCTWSNCPNFEVHVSHYDGGGWCSTVCKFKDYLVTRGGAETREQALKVFEEVILSDKAFERDESRNFDDCSCPRCESKIFHVLQLRNRDERVLGCICGNDYDSMDLVP